MPLAQFDELPLAESHLQMVDILLQDLDFPGAGDGDLDGGVEPGVGDGFQQVRGNSVLDRLIDEIGMAMGGQDNDRRTRVFGNLPRSGQTVHAWHFDVKEDCVGE